MNYLQEHYNEIFKKYSNEEIIKDIEKFKYDDGSLQKTLNQFFEETIFKCCGKKSDLSPWDALQNEEITNKILSYIESKPKFFTGTEIQNVKSSLRNSFSWCRKVANFPPKEARNIYFRYNDINGEKINCLDTSMGFGSRMSSVVLSGHNYCGFDPNKELFKQLKKYKKFLKENNLIEENQKIGLYNHGSEIYRPELKELFDVSFTSPPYFNLEKYSNDESASTKNYNDYRKWVDEFVIPTIFNTYLYLKVGGYAMINIKNITKKETCFDDYFKAFGYINGFEYVETFDLKISKKQYGKQYNDEKGVINNTEPVMVFKKVK